MNCCTPFYRFACVSLQSVALVFALAVVGGCDDDENGGGGGGGALTDAEAAETAAAFAFTGVGAVGRLQDAGDNLQPGADQQVLKRGKSTIGSLARKAIAGIRSQGIAPVQCPTLACETGDGTVTVTFVHDDCTQETETGSRITSGSMSMTFPSESTLICDCINGDQDACDELGGDFGFGDLSNFTIVFDNFEERVFEGEELVERSFADGTFESNLTPVEGECPDVSTGTTSFDGTFENFFAGDEENEEENSRVVADNLTMLFEALEDVCGQALTLNGTITETDLTDDSSSTVTLDDLRVESQQIDETTESITIEGTISSDCLGTVTYETVEPIIINDDSDCPTGGVLLATTDGGLVTRITFNEDGSVEVDAGDDGSPEIFESCEEIEADDSCD